MPTPFVAAVETTPERRPRKLKLLPVKGFRQREVERLARQHLAAGDWQDLNAIASHWHRQQRFEPRMNEAHRERLYAGWLDAVKRVRSEA